MQAGKWYSVAVYLSSRGNLWKNFIGFPCLLLQHWCCALGRGKQYTGLEVSQLTWLFLLFRCVLRWEQWKELHAVPEEFRQSQTTQCLSNADCKRWPGTAYRAHSHELRTRRLDIRVSGLSHVTREVWERCTELSQLITDNTHSFSMRYAHRGWALFVVDTNENLTIT